MTVRKSDQTRACGVNSTLDKHNSTSRFNSAVNWINAIPLVLILQTGALPPALRDTPSSLSLSQTYTHALAQSNTQPHPALPPSKAPTPTSTPNPPPLAQVHPSRHISSRSHHAIKTRRRMRRQANLFPAWSYITLAGRLYPWAKSKFTQRERAAGQRGSGVSTFQMAADMNPADWQVWQKGAWRAEGWSSGSSVFLFLQRLLLFSRKRIKLSGSFFENWIKGLLPPQTGHICTTSAFNPQVRFKRKKKICKKYKVKKSCFTVNSAVVYH